MLSVPGQAIPCSSTCSPLWIRVSFPAGSSPGWDWGRDRAKISYSKVAAAKYKALEMVFDALGSLPDSSFDRFREDNQDWLEDYALFAAIYEQFQYLPLPLWGDGVARRSHAELDRLRIRLDRRIRFYEYLQYLFYGQWGQLRRYAAQKGVRLMGLNDLRAARNQCGAVDRSRCQ